MTRRGAGTSVETLDGSSWQYWWALNHPDVLPRVRRQHGEADGRYARQLPVELHAGVDLVLGALSDRDADVRYAAAGALAGFRCEYRATETTAALREGARGSDLWLRDLCHLGLGLRRDEAALRGVRRTALNRHEPDVSRVFAALALLQAGDTESVEDLRALTADLKSPEVAGGILAGLGGTGDVAHLPLILDAARRRGGSAPRLRRLRADAIAALGRIAHPATVPVLVEMLEDREHVIARSAAIALGGFRGNAEAATALGTTCLSAEDPWLRAFSAISLGRVAAPQGLPHLARMVREEPNPAVRPFATLALGLARSPGSERSLPGLLGEDPRAGGFGAAALAAGLLGPREQRAVLSPALDDPRTTIAPACAAIACGLLGDTADRAPLRARFWLDSSRLRPGFDRALVLLGAEEQAGWLVQELGKARRGSERRVLVDALALCGGPSEVATLTALHELAGPGDVRLRVRVVAALAEILRDHEVTYARGLLMHTYWLQSNDALAHLGALP